MSSGVNQVAVGRPGWREVAGELAFLVRRAFLLAVVFGLVFTLAAIAMSAPQVPEDAFRPEVPAVPRPEDATSGSLLVRRADGGDWAAAPVLSTEAVFRVSGTVARARVTQKFRNGADEFVEGVYVFPLPENAAVDHLRLRVGVRLVEGQIREREAARAEYARAAAEGRRAGLVEQHRPNVFTTSVANVAPGEEVSVEIEFQQTLSFDEGEVRLRFPLVVGPRYVPGSPLAAAVDGGGWSPDTDRVSDASHVTPPVRLVSETRHNPVRIRVELDAGFPVRSVVSRYHPVVAEARGEGRYRVRLRDPLSPADRDFELAWTPQDGARPRSALFEEARPDGRYLLLTLFPPSGGAVERGRVAREIVFVIDTSGSMEGPSLVQARRALVLALDRLSPADRFNVVRFSDRTEPLFPSPQKADARTVEVAKDWVGGLRANGGTEMRPALEAALAGGDDASLVRQVVFLTDGSVANEDELFGVIRQRLGDARLFTIGIGSAPNGHFMTKAAELGRGSFTCVGDVREVEEKVGKLLLRLESPVLTGVEVRWPAGVAVEAWPARVGDLYAGEPIVLAARVTGVPSSPVVVSGRRGAEEWRASLPLDGGRPGEGLAVLWARRKVEALLDSLRDGADAGAVKAQVVALGLEHHLVTKHTSLVAVDVTPVRPEGAPLETRPVPVNLPHGWSSEAVFGELPQTATRAPEDAALAAAALAAAALLWLAGAREGR
ncbi:MAG: marine proteobacterial sortase target protein [Vicinamibacteria bacterium]